MQGLFVPKRHRVTWSVVTEEVPLAIGSAHRVSSRAGETEVQELCLWYQIVGAWWMSPGSVPSPQGDL